MKRPRLSHQIFWGTTWLNIANGIGMVMGFLNQVVLVRCMGLSEYGSMQIAMAAFDIVVIFFDFNLYYSAIRYGGEALARGDRDKYEQVFSAALQIKLALATILILISAGVWGLGLSYKGQTLGASFLLLAVNYLFAALLGYSTTVYNTDKRFGVVSFQNATTVVVTTSLMALAAWLRGTMEAVLFGQAVGTLLVMAGALWFVRERIFFRRITRAVLREVSVYAAQFAVSSVMKRILGKTDMLIVGYFLSARDAGLFRIAQSFASPIYSAIGPLWNVLFPIVSELAGKDEYGKIMALMIRGGRLLTVGIVPVAAAASILLGPFLRIAYKVDSPEAIATSTLLLWASAISVTTTVFPPVLRVFRNEVAVWYSIVTTLMNISLDLFLVPRIGIIGCALSTLIMVSLGLAFLYVYLYRFLAPLTEKRYDRGYLAIYPAMALILVSAYMRTHLLTAAGAALVVVAAIVFKLITWEEIREVLPSVKRAKDPSASSAPSAVE